MEENLGEHEKGEENEDKGSTTLQCRWKVTCIEAKQLLMGW